MTGLVAYTVLGFYLWGCYRITLWAKGEALKAGVAPWRYMIPTAIISYGLLFWDWIPTFATHQYHCAQYAGFTVYKTLAEWKTENLGVAATLTPIKRAKWQYEGEITRVPLNERFIWEFEDSTHWFGIHERDQRIIDIQTNEVLAQHIDYDSAIKNPLKSSQNASFRDYKSWLAWGTESCEWGMWPKKQIKFNRFYTKIRQLGSEQ